MNATADFRVGEYKVPKWSHSARPPESLCWEAGVEFWTCPAAENTAFLLGSAASSVKAKHRGGGGAVQKKIIMVLWWNKCMVSFLHKYMDIYIWNAHIMHKYVYTACMKVFWKETHSRSTPKSSKTSQICLLSEKTWGGRAAEAGGSCAVQGGRCPTRSLMLTHPYLQGTFSWGFSPAMLPVRCMHKVWSCGLGRRQRSLNCIVHAAGRLVSSPSSMRWLGQLNLKAALENNTLRD